MCVCKESFYVCARWNSPYHVDVTVESTETKVEVSLGLRLYDLARRSESGLEELGKGDGSVVPPSCD